MTKKLIKRIIFYSIPLFFSVFLTLLLCEFIARYFNLSKTWASYKGSITISQFMQMKDNNIIGYKRIPNKSFIAPRNITFNINSIGYRDKYFNIEKNNDTIRVTIIGDSVTEGFGVKINDRFTNYAEKKLNETAGQKYEFFNFGISGHSTYDQLDILRNDVLKFKPDYVLLQFGFNDIRENKIKHNSLFKVKSESNTKERKTNKPEPLLNKGFKSFFQNHSALYLFLAEIYNTYKLNHNVPNSILYDVLATTEEDWELTLELLKKIASECEENNITFLLTYAPLDVEVQIKDRGKGEFINSRLKQFSLENNIAFADVVKALRETPHSNLYIDDVHLSVTGNAVVGDIITEYFNNIIVS